MELFILRPVCVIENNSRMTGGKVDDNETFRKNHQYLPDHVHAVHGSLSPGGRL